MISVLAQTITDYIHAINIGGVDFQTKLKSERIKIMKEKGEERRIKIMSRGQAAKCYIFDDTKASDNYIFGFKFICRYLSIDPERFREKIRGKREEFWKNIFKNIRKE